MRRAVSHPSWYIGGALQRAKPAGQAADDGYWNTLVLTLADWVRAGALALPADRR